jgi:hypothetical protein
MILQPVTNPYTDNDIPVAIYVHLRQNNYTGVSTVTKRESKLFPSILTREIVVLNYIVANQ